MGDNNITITTKEKIFEVAVTLFSQKGFHGTSIRDIAKNVGIKESSVYNHFSSKKAILQAILDYQMDGLEKAVIAFDNLKPLMNTKIDPVDFWMIGVAEYIKHLPEFSETISKIIINEMYLNEQCRKFYLNTLQRGRKELTEKILGLMHTNGMIKDCDTKKTATAYIYMIQGLEIENNLKIIEGGDFESSQQNFLDHISCFIKKLT